MLHYVAGCQELKDISKKLNAVNSSTSISLSSILRDLTMMGILLWPNCVVRDRCDPLLGNCKLSRGLWALLLSLTIVKPHW